MKFSSILVLIAMTALLQVAHSSCFTNPGKCARNLENKVKGVLENPGTLVAAVVTVATAGAAAPVLASTLGVSATAGAAIAAGATNGVVTAVNGGSPKDIIKSAISGSVTGAGASAIGTAVPGTAFTDVATRAVGEAVVGGVSAEIQGGSFKDGFLAGAAGEVATSTIGSVVNLETRTDFAAAGAVGGAFVAGATGGDFVQGALQGAAVGMYNHYAHTEQGIRDYLKENGVGINTEDATRTKVEGMQPSTVDFLTQLSKEFDGNLIVTGGTEPLHANGVHSHISGHKVDLRTKDNNLVEFIAAHPDFKEVSGGKPGKHGGRLFEGIYHGNKVTAVYETIGIPDKDFHLDVKIIPIEAK